MGDVSYVRRDNFRHVSVDPRNLNPLEGTLTVDGKSAVHEVSGPCVASFHLDVSAVSASDTVDVTIETSIDGVTWYSAGTFTQATETENAAWDQLLVAAVERFVRADFNVGGAAVSIACTLTGRVKE